MSYAEIVRISILLPGMLCVGMGCGDAFVPGTTGQGGSGGGGATVGSGGASGDPIGCADGERELFVDEAASPNVAGCSGGFDVPGVTTAESKALGCGRDGGDDGGNKDGVGCSVADLCAEGWHVCQSLDEIDVAGCPNDGNEDPAFFVTRVSTAPGAVSCSASGNDNLVGCGVGVGQAPSPADSCSPLDSVLIFSLCDTELDAWDCGANADLEVDVVTKPKKDEGGALCCRDA